MQQWPREELRAWLADVLGIPVSNVVWQDEGRPIVGPKGGNLGGLLTINITSDETEVSEESWEPVGDSGAAVVTTQNIDLINLSLLYESFESPKKKIARDVLGRLRIKGFQWFFRKKLNAFGMVLVDVSTMHSYSTVVDDLKVSASMLDVQLRYTMLDTISEEPTDFIESVDVIGTVSFPEFMVLDDSVSALSTATPIGDVLTGWPDTILATTRKNVDPGAVVTVSTS